MNYGELALKYGKTVEEVSQVVEFARRSMAQKEERIQVVEFDKAQELRVTRQGVGPLKTRHGHFHHFDFKVNDRWEKYSVLAMCDLSPDFRPIFRDTNTLMIRTDSGCETGQLFGDLTCECRDQLHKCLKKIAERGEGMVIHIPRQDGRGMGLPFKLATLRLQTELGVDTCESSYLMDPDGSRDIRTYAGVVAILKFLGIPTSTVIQLETNNPKKVHVFEENGYKVSTDPLVIAPTRDTYHHLLAKQKELGHIDLIAIEKPDKKAVSCKVLDNLDQCVESRNTLVCCGLDPDIDKIPEVLRRETDAEAAILEFLTQVVEATNEHVCAYKIQKAFFDMYPGGRHVLKSLVRFIRECTPCTPVIIDCKIGDIENTMRVYLQSILGDLDADGVVVNPYMGTDVLQPLSSYPDKLGIVLVKTSNPGGDIVQEVSLQDERPLWRYVLDLVVGEWEKGNALVPCLSSNSDHSVDDIRASIPDEMPILLAGMGAQGGRMGCLPSALNAGKRGVLVNSSRALLYPFPPSETSWRDAIVNAVVEFKSAINEFRL